MFKFLFKMSAVGAVAIMAFTQSVEAAKIKGNNITLRIGSGHPPFITYVKSASKFFVPNVN